LSKPGLVGRQRWRWKLNAAGVGDQIIYVKRYARPPLKPQWDRLLRQSPSHSSAWWEYQQSQALARAGIPAVEAIGYAEQMRGPFERCSAVLLRQAPGDAFDRYWQAAQRQGDARTRGAARHALTRQLARFVAAFHASGCCHRDLYLCHVFIDCEPQAGRNAEGGEPQLRLIDLARAFRPRWRRERWRVKDLSQLDASARQIGASRGDRLRFLLAYLDLARCSARARRLAERVTAKSERILKRIARKAAVGTGEAPPSG
jgi:heptose I phosphotransferase